MHRSRPLPGKAQRHLDLAGVRERRTDASLSLAKKSKMLSQEAHPTVDFSIARDEPW
jgi:hypothetical protein